MTIYTETIDPGELVGLYDWLSRFNLLLNLLNGGRLEADLTIHKSLRVPAELESTYAGIHAPMFINDRALDVAGLGANPRVLDAGCGFGGTVFRWYERLGGTYDGLTQSPVQLRFARRAARRRGLSSCCRFHLGSYDEPLASTYDAVVSIEALIYSPNLEHTLANLAAALAPGGKLVLVDDVLRERPAGDRDLAQIEKYWRLSDPLTDSMLAAVLKPARLRLVHYEDLTAGVRTRPGDQLRRLEKRYRRAHHWLPLAGPRFVLEAFLGGLALERLYQKGFMRYRLLVAGRGE